MKMRLLRLNEKTQLLQDQANAQREHDEAVDEVDKDKLRNAKDNLWIAESKLKRTLKSWKTCTMKHWWILKILSQKSMN